jgi:hypothetical protein
MVPGACGGTAAIADVHKVATSEKTRIRRVCMWPSSCVAQREQYIRVASHRLNFYQVWLSSANGAISLIFSHRCSESRQK